MPLDDHVSTSPMVSQSATPALPQKGKIGAKGKKSGPKDEILINPDSKQIMQEESEKHHVLTFGRMNPITTGHEAVVKKIHDVAKENNAGHTLVVSHSQDAKKNPLTASQKLEHAKHAFPNTNVIAASKEHPTILHHAAALSKQGVKHLHVVAGSDRTDEMKDLLHKYNGQASKHGEYNFKSITVHSSGERDPDAEGTTGMSASKMREHAAAGNEKEFHKGAPSSMSSKQKSAMYNDVRNGMKLNEEFELFERVISLQQRRARGVIMRRMKSRLTRARQISRVRAATPQQLERRAYKQAKQNIRRRFAGQRGVEYQTLGPSGKVAVDQIIDPKVANIKAMVKRLLPRVKQSDFKRLNAVRAGKAYHSSMTQFNSVELDMDKFNKLYESVFKEQTPVKANLNESFGSFYTAKDLGIVAEGGFAMHPSVQGQLDEDAASHLRQAAIAQRTGKFQTANMHRKIAAALQHGDATAARAMTAELNNIVE